MNVSRESVSQALLARFTPLLGSPFTTVSRILVPFTGIDVSKLPALYIVEDDENDDQKQLIGTGLATQNFGLEDYLLDYALWIYTPVFGNDLIPPAIGLNNALDAVDRAITGPIPGDQQSLGGLVTNCWIRGKIIKQVGIVGQGTPSVARIPVTILTGA